MSTEDLTVSGLGPPLRRTLAGFGSPGCGGSTDNCTWSYSGSTGMTASAEAPQADVVVGVEVYYTDPYSYQPGGSPMPIFPGGSPDCTYDSDCPVNEVCKNGHCVQPPPPPVKVPGAVLGISKLYCANAESVAQGNNAATKSVDLSFVPPAIPGVTVKKGTLAAAKGAYALDGAHIVYSQDGATQIAFTYRQFAHNVGEGSRQLTAYLPSKASSVPTQTASIGCYSAGDDLYLLGLSVALTEESMMSTSPGYVPQLGYLSVLCQSYVDLFQMPDSKKVACCLGQKHWWCWGYDPQSSKCDQAMASYCAPLCSGGVCADPVCDCLGSPVAADGVAQCFDSRCVNNPQAYRTATMSTSSCKGKDLTCEQWKALGDGKYVASGVSIPTGCTAPPPPSDGGIIAWLEKNPWMVVAIVIFLILVAFAIMPSSKSSGRAPPKLPPGALPQLPSLESLGP